MAVSKKYKLFFVSLGVIALFVYAYIDYEHNKSIIAKVGQFEISKQEFEKELAYRGGDYPELLNKKLLLEEMISKKLFLNKAYTMELPSSEAVEREYYHLLIGKVRKTYIEKVRRAIKISDENIKLAYEKNREKYKIPNQRKFAILFLKKRLKNSQKERELVTQKFKNITNLSRDNKLPEPKKGFGAYAIDYSEHQMSRYRGGELGWFTKGKRINWEQSILNVGFRLKKVGNLSSMIETDKGYYLVRVMAEKEEKFQSFEKVKAKVRHQLILTKQKEVKDDFEKLLRAEFNVEVDFSKLGELNRSKMIGEKKPPMGHI